MADFNIHELEVDELKIKDIKRLPIGFGKFKELSLIVLILEEPSYCDWLIENVVDQETVDYLGLIREHVLLSIKYKGK